MQEDDIFRQAEETANLASYGLSFTQLRVLEERIVGNEQDAVRHRWTFGQEVVARLTPLGGREQTLVKNALIDLLHISKAELNHRLVLARKYTPGELNAALTTMPSWHQIVSQGLYVPKGPRPKAGKRKSFRDVLVMYNQMRQQDATVDDWPFVQLLKALFDEEREVVLDDDGNYVIRE